MPREVVIDGLTMRLRRIRRYRCSRTVTYAEVLHEGRWLDCGDPHHGETSSAPARAALAHYARLAIHKANTATG